MGIIERFGHFEIAQEAEGLPVQLVRAASEHVVLAFDSRIGRLIELHILKSGQPLRPSEKRSAFERIALAMEVKGGCFVRILESGEDQEVGYYSSNLNDGEPLDAYIQRRGALPPPTAFSLVLQLLDDMIPLQSSPKLMVGLQLEKLFISLMEETFLQLRVVDFGFSEPYDPAADEQEVLRRHVHAVCRIIFLMLTGKPHAGDDCDRFPVLTGLPTGLRAMLRSSLTNPDNAPSSLQRLRDEVREALMAQTRDLQGRVSRRHLVALDNMLPESALRKILLHDVRMEQLLKGRLVPEGQDGVQRYPFTFQGTDARTDAPVTVHLLPPRRIVSNERYDAVPLQMWRFNAEKHPNILRSLSVWESPDLTFLTEERGPGFPLSRLIAERVHLNPPEVLLILRQVKRGLEQALECGVERLDLHPCNILLRVKAGTHAREMDKLLQKRLDAWPKFMVMLRPHMTMRSLYEPLLVEVPAQGSGDEFFDAKDFRARSFVALAAYLLSGERQTGTRLRLPDSVSEELALYVADCAEQARMSGRAPTPQEFLAGFEKRASVPELEDGSAGGLVLPARRGAQREAVAVGPMESAGAVSDFEEDADSGSPGGWPASGRKPDPLLFRQSQVDTSPIKAPPKGSLALLLWAALFVVIVFIGYALFSAGNKPTTPSGTAEQPSTQVPPVKNGRTLTPEEIRRALLPSEPEKEELRRKQTPASKPEPQAVDRGGDAGMSAADKPDGTPESRLATALVPDAE